MRKSGALRRERCSSQPVEEADSATQQVGTEFWRCVSAQLAARGANASALASLVQQTHSDTRAGEATPQARCVLVDAEPKAVRSCTASEPLLARAASACGQSGKGSNFAHGYRQPGEPGGGNHGGDSDRSLLARALTAVRRELEKCPSRPDIVLVHGLAGGTGGGLGCRLLEELRHSYGDLFIASVAVAPRAPTSDTSLLAPLGMVLCTQFLTQYADAVLLFQVRAAAYIMLLYWLRAQHSRAHAAAERGAGGVAGAAAAPSGHVHAARDAERHEPRVRHVPRGRALADGWRRHAARCARHCGAGAPWVMRAAAAAVCARRFSFSASC